MARFGPTSIGSHEYSVHSASSHTPLPMLRRMCHSCRAELPARTPFWLPAVIHRGALTHIPFDKKHFDEPSRSDVRRPTRWSLIQHAASPPTPKTTKKAFSCSTRDMQTGLLALKFFKCKGAANCLQFVGNSFFSFWCQKVKRVVLQPFAPITH